MFVGPSVEFKAEICWEFLSELLSSMGDISHKGAG